MICDMVSCRWCHSSNLKILWELRDAPYGDLFRDNKQSAQMEPVHPFRVATCESCNLLQLRDSTDISGQYDNYLYQTNVTVGLSEYYFKVAEKILTLRTGLSTNTVLDIGSNDGSFLTFFMRHGSQVLGVEPSKVPAQEARLRKIETINDYFSFHLSEAIRQEHHKGFDLISVIYTLANVPDIRDFMKGLELLLSDKGMFSIITGYHPDQFSIGMFDYIGHDHLTYFSLKNLIEMFSELDLEIFEANRSEHKGGSIHIVGGRKGTYPKKSMHGYVLQREEWNWPSNEKGIEVLKERTEKAKELTLKALKPTSKSWLGIGASISTSYLINEFELGQRIAFQVDDDLIKQGRYSPLHGIEVIPFEDAKVKKGQNALLLAWQHTNVLMTRLRNSGFKGEVLIPLPEPRLLFIN